MVIAAAGLAAAWSVRVDLLTWIQGAAGGRSTGDAGLYAGENVS